MRSAAMTAGMVIVLAMVVAARADTPEPEALPTQDELHQLYKDKQYQPLLQKMARVLLLRGNAAKRYDRVDLLMLKGDTHLQLKEQSLAGNAYAAAVKEINDQTDAKEAAVAKATSLLFKKSRNYTFTPQTAARGQVPQPISVVDLDQRTVCFAAMFDDARVQIVSKVKAAKSSKTLQPIVDAVNAVAELRTLEMAAYGKDEQSAAQLDGLALQAKDLMTRAVKDLKSQAEKCNQRANDLLPVHLTQNSGAVSPEQLYYKKGLEGNMQRELKGIISDCDRIAEAAKQFSEVSKSVADAFGEVQDAAEKVAKAAKTTLEDDYTGTYTK
jgi:hypothetical protein